MSFLWHSLFLPVIKNNKTGKLGNITIVPYMFLQTLMRIYIFVSTESCFAELFDTDINSH